MNYAVEFHSLNSQNNSWTAEQQISRAERTSWIHDSPKTVGSLEGLWKVVRTNGWSNFSKDFFLPLFMHQAMKVETAVLKVFARIGAIVVDLLTLSVRAVTLIPRFVGNWKRHSPAVAWLSQQENVPNWLKKADQVDVYLTLQDPSQEGTACASINKINLVEVPAVYQPKPKPSSNEALPQAISASN